MPIDYKEYGKDWSRISKAVIMRAGMRCELCGAWNGERIRRLTKCKAVWVPDCEDLADSVEWGKPIRVVLTVHHIDGCKTNHNKNNLIALCQRCHLKLDVGYKVRFRVERKVRDKSKLGYRVEVFRELGLL